ncbi:hypothetical protein [Amycolatopsis sp. cmx-11-12]|uniref:hypothetical protein n=1 Tax=Amycolatopsis sp. cmx-11-12 TaxID=2785795 RepID=UPI003918327C
MPFAFRYDVTAPGAKVGTGLGPIRSGAEIGGMAEDALSGVTVTVAVVNYFTGRRSSQGVTCAEGSAIWRAPTIGMHGCCTFIAIRAMRRGTLDRADAGVRDHPVTYSGVGTGSGSHGAAPGSKHVGVEVGEGIRSFAVRRLRTVGGSRGGDEQATVTMDLSQSGNVHGGFHRNRWAGVRVSRSRMLDMVALDGVSRY